MPKIECLRAECNNSVFNDLYAEWSASLTELGVDEEEFSTAYIDHARRIAKEDPPSKTYGIFVCRDGETGEALALFHANTARLPKTKGTTLRILWILAAPKYDFEDQSEETIGHFTAGVMTSVRMIQYSHMPADHVKMHLNSAIDRRYLRGFAASYESNDSGLKVAVRGNWLYMKSVEPV